MMYVQRYYLAFLALLVNSSAVYSADQVSRYDSVYQQETMRCHWHEVEVLAPHNVAARVVEFSRELDLTHEQLSRTLSLVEEYDRENRNRERELEAAQSDLYKILRGENIEFSQAVERADKITRLEFYLWQEFIDHLQQVKEILTTPQKKILRTLWAVKCKSY